MASKKPPTYVHCAKCGYNGVSPNHDCTVVRANTARVATINAQRQLDSIASEIVVANPCDVIVVANPCDVNGVPMADLEAPLSIATQLVRLSIEHRRQFGRGIEYALVGQESGASDVVVQLSQRCAACCEVIGKMVHVHTNEDLWTLKLGAESRKAYLLHRCPPVESSLLGFTWEEIEELEVGLDRDMQAIADRLAAIRVLKKSRVT